MAALQLPVVLTKLAYLIDNPWAVSLDRATSAGLILADSIIDRNLGTRPITLVGYSLGSRVIFSCLRELARKGAYGLVQNVYMFGSPVVVAPDEWVRARTVVSGRFVNAYNGNDWILGYLFRLTNGGIRRVAGLAPIMDIPGVENMDVSEFVVGHMDYRTAMPRLLREAGWLVESDEFSEIEEADPEKYQERQRELMTEIEEARKELEKEKSEGKTGRIAAFFRKKKQEKQAWELYEDNKANPPAGRGEEGEAHNRAVLFDVDAIRAELAKEKGESGGEGDRANAYAPNVEEAMFQVKEIKSTLPPMKLDLTPAASPGLGLPAASTSSSSSSFISPGLFPSRGTKSVEMLPDRSSSEHRARSPSYWTGRLDHGDEYYHVGGHEAGDDGIQMTFDTSFDRGGPKVSHGRRLTLDTAAAKDATLSPAPVRTGRGAAQTVPNIAVHDHWADEVEEEFGKEKEITMTFA